jgi:proline racemase
MPLRRWAGFSNQSRAQTGARTHARTHARTLARSQAEAKDVGGRKAVLSTIAGRAWVTQHCQVVCDPTDIFPVGYTVGDIWSS